MSELLTIGVDPGPTPGIVALRWSGVLLEDAEIVQCTPGIASAVVRELIHRAWHPDLRTLVQIERFVVGRGSAKSGRAGAITRDLVGEVQRTVRDQDSPSNPVVALQQSAGRVKPWATDGRLLALKLTHPTGPADLYRLTAGMRHARDAARHALFAAVHDGGTPDPLSTQSKTTHDRGARR